MKNVLLSSLFIILASCYSNDNNTKPETKSENKTKLFNQVNYVINNVQKDKINNLDTKIPSDEYTVIVTNANFFVRLYGTYIKSEDKSTYNPSRIDCFKDNGTWHFSADYSGGESYGNGTWMINTIVIKNTEINVIPDQGIDLEGEDEGSFEKKPEGL